MKIESKVNDVGILRELGERLAGIRLERNLTQADMAEQAGVSKRTVERLESGEVAMQLSSFVRVCRVLGLIDRLDLLIPEPTPSPMAQLKLSKRKRKRASGKNAAAAVSKKWTWSESE